MIIRPRYMEILRTYRDVPLVKILAGIRRCGKSTILDMLKDDLLKSGIAADHIISMRYTSEDFDDGMTDIEPERITCKKMSDQNYAWLWNKFIFHSQSCFAVIYLPTASDSPEIPFSSITLFRYSSSCGDSSSRCSCQ